MTKEVVSKVEELQEMVRKIVREELGRSVQDVEEIRRSPAGAVIRMEEEIKVIRREMVTKEEFGKLETKVAELSVRVDGLSEKAEDHSKRIETLSARVESLSGKMNLVISLVFVMLALYGGLIAKLVFFP